MNAALLYNGHCELGEGPMWHPAEQCLYWVDILGKQLHRYDTSLNRHQSFQFNAMPGAVVPTNTDELLIAFENGIATFNATVNKIDYLLSMHENNIELRCNDGKCDPLGNFWIGSMSKKALPGAGNLYCLKPDLDFAVKLPGTSISNGLAWTEDGSKMFYIDSLSDTVRCFDFNKKGEIANSTVVIEGDFKTMGYLDGMAIDTEGMLWIAHCNGGCVRRWNPVTGEVLATIDLPVPKVTSCCFGGSGYQTLFITTAKEHLTAEERKQFPLSGATFFAHTAYQGYQTNQFSLST